MAQARPIQEKKERNPRRSAPFFGGAFAAGAAGLGAVDETGDVAAAAGAGGELEILGLGSDMTDHLAPKKYA